NSPEATSPLALLSPYVRFERTTLIIIGQVNWTSAFLRGLHSEATWVLLPGEDEAVFRKQFDDGMMDLNILAMVVVDKPKDPFSWLKNDRVGYERFLFWMTLGPGMENTIPQNPPSVMCSRPSGLAVTAPNGGTTLYSVARQDCSFRAPTLVEVDQWSPSRQSWRRTDAMFAVFRPLCSEWQPPTVSKSVNFFRFTGPGRESLFPELTAIIIRRTRAMGFPWNIKVTTENDIPHFNVKTITYTLAHAVEQCSLSILLLGNGVVGRLDTRQVVLMPEKKMYPITVYVPVGFGPAINPLEAVLVEFTPAVWLGTVLAALSTAVALACTLHRDRGAALLLALAPLLGQAPGTPPPAGRALRP
ncbi:Ionotropic receptor 155, partial [Frankliniella occidentalis]